MIELTTAIWLAFAPQIISEGTLSSGTITPTPQAEASGEITQTDCLTLCEDIWASTDMPADPFERTDGTLTEADLEKGDGCDCESPWGPELPR